LAQTGAAVVELLDFSFDYFRRWHYQLGIRNYELGIESRAGGMGLL
jgi:hypothetical protein